MNANLLRWMSEQVAEANYGASRGVGFYPSATLGRTDLPERSNLLPS